jgi:hypothetical protein
MPLMPAFWGVRVDFHPLGLVADEPPPFVAPRIPRALLAALVGVRELRGEPEEDGWQLYRDGVPIGRVSRPAPVALVRLIAPGRAAFPDSGASPAPLPSTTGPGLART